jgi:hypothetical protein
MPKDLDHFLARAPVLEEGPSLGRAFAVIRESWLLSEDPQAVAPRIDMMASRRTALNAADLSREAAEAFHHHGFHKASGAWWGSDGVRMHRFAVRPFKRAQIPLVGSSFLALAAVTAITLVNIARKTRRPPQSRA